MTEKLIAAFDRYDTLLHGHITEDISDRNDPELEKAAVELNKIVHEATEYAKGRILSENYDRLVVFDTATNTELAVITEGDTPITAASDNIVVKLKPKGADCDIIVTMKSC
jgi:hypothetical protein